jgi:hypothetical protein
MCAPSDLIMFFQAGIWARNSANLSGPTQSPGLAKIRFPEVLIPSSSM